MCVCVHAQNKIAIVKSLKRIGQTPSMTGDGVNDAPALAAADIGVAMGITGTDVSKAAAKMVLADDNFATIVSAVREGRRVWDNLVKILLYNMPVNFAQGLSVFFAYVLRMETVPLTAIQVLYVNMITSVTMGLMYVCMYGSVCV
jgi:P-type E1-E2 ATPase